MSDASNDTTLADRYVEFAQAAIAAAKDRGSNMGMCFFVALDDAGQYRWHRVIAQHDVFSGDWRAVGLQSLDSWPYASDAEVAMREAIDITYQAVPAAVPYISDDEITDLLDGEA